MATALGRIETRLFAYVQMRRLQTVRTGELVHALGLTPQQERELLSRLARRNLIARIRRGLYLVPPRLPPGGKWSPSEFLALTTLIERDYYCSLLLEDLLAVTSQPWVFKGGTCLSKVHSEFRHQKVFRRYLRKTPAQEWSRSRRRDGPR
jgi:hypothetical protein